MNKRSDENATRPLPGQITTTSAKVDNILELIEATPMVAAESKDNTKFKALFRESEFSTDSRSRNEETSQ